MLPNRNLSTGKTSAERRLGRKASILSICVAASLVVAVLSYFRALLWENNLHAVLPGEVYRSAQPAPDELDRLITRVGLRTVVSLRGGEDDWEWYAVQKEVCRRQNVNLQAVHLDPNRLPSKSDLCKLIRILDTSPRPILLHCSRGIDRSGLASAVSQMLAGDGPSTAAGQFHLKYGYFAAVGHSDLPQVLTLYENWLGRRSHSPARFRRWVKEEYVAYFYQADIQLRRAQRAATAEPLKIIPGTATSLGFRLTNISPLAWQFRSTRDTGVHLGMRVERIDGAAPVQPVELRAGYENIAVPPGRTIELNATIPPLSGPGRYRLTVDLVDESVVWFADMGSTPLHLQLHVADESVAGL